MARWAGHTIAGIGVLFVYLMVFPAFFRPANTPSWTSFHSLSAFFRCVEDDPIPWLSVYDTHSECTLSPPPQATTQPAITLSPPPVPSPATLPSATISSEPEGAVSIGMDDVISRKVLAVIARDYVKHWKTLGPFLDLSRQQEIAITETYPNNYHLQKWECLEVWSDMKGTGATYRAFITAAEEARDHDLAHRVKDMTKSQSPSPPPTS